jgi:hypothetical protein
MFCIAIKKDGGKCGNKAKFGNLCGVHNNSVKIASAKASSSKASSSKLTTLEKFDKYVKKLNNKKKKSFADKIDKPSRRASN